MIKETIQLIHIDSKSFGQFIQEIIRKELSEYKVNTQEEKNTTHVKKRLSFLM